VHPVKPGWLKYQLYWNNQNIVNFDCSRHKPINIMSSIPAIKVTQWLSDWNDVHFGPGRKKPAPHFFIFSINANTLKRLSKVYPRKADDNRNTEVGVQRKHDPDRSEKIRQYVFGGFPWSDLSDAKRKSNEFSDLKMPGWLPTAIIANILAPNTVRGGQTIKKADLITLEDKNNSPKLILPSDADSKKWIPDVPPIEIIDGQHRLWAFGKDEKLDGNFDLPVVAFYDLDVAWQAYLFYTINIKPKKINASLAFDLYPILRVQDWLERSPDGAFVYKETRAQELTEVLWSYDGSPWKDRINMLGERFEKGGEMVNPTITQAAFIRNLIAGFIKTTTTRDLGGLYGSVLKDKNLLLWNRTQQAAFLVFVWEIMVKTIEDCKEDWAKALRNYYKSPQGKMFQEEVQELDPAYASKLSLIATDQGVRGFLHIINDFVYVVSDTIKLNEIQFSDEIKEDRIDAADVKKSVTVFRKSVKLKTYIESIAAELVKFDWRTASTPGLTNEERQKQMIYKGSSGYREIRSELLKVLLASKDKLISSNAKLIINELGYAK
jgi:DGQHR domain-containing protein